MSVADGPRNARGRRTRQALLTAGKSLIEAEGLGALTMASVAERAGVSRRAVYLHFHTRTDLIAALFTYVTEVEDLAGSMQPVWDAPDATTALTAWARHLAHHHPRTIPIGRELQRAQGTDPDATAHWELVMREWRSHCRKLAAWLDREHSLAPNWTVDTAADMLWAMMSLDVIEGLLHHRRWSRRRLADRLTDLFHATFVQDAQDARGDRSGPSGRGGRGGRGGRSGRSAESTRAG